ncbi:MAG: M23 family metallopeptidase [Bdellovibrio sp.]|jgi:hypothetical protein
MKKNTLALFGVLTTLSSFSLAEPIDAFSSTYYAETQEQVRLFLKSDIAGKSLLLPKFTVPAESILSLDVRMMSTAIEDQKIAPERVNQEYSENEDGSNSKRSKGGWICGIRVVDILDEELRESEMLERDDYCLSQTMLKRLKTMEGNSEPVKEAVTLQQTQQDDRLLKSIATSLDVLDADAKWRIQNILVEASASNKRMMSPLKNCGNGCLKVTSEYGMRRHPVLRKTRLHKGIDLRAATGTPVVAVFDGKVLANRSEVNRRTKKLTGYGLYTIVVYPQVGMQSLYAHLSKHSLRNGTAVTQGQTVAISGSTGIGTGAHLHFETHTLSRGASVVKNPRLFMSHLFAQVASFFRFFDLTKST